MWIVQLALRRPYTFVVAALLLLIVGPIAILRTPKDIFPNIDIPVLTVIWNYTGLSAQEMTDRIVSNYERNVTIGVNDIEHIESQSYNGKAIIKVFFHPSVHIDLAMAQVTAASQSAVRQAPPGTVPPFILVFNASSVPVLQLALSGKNMSEQQLADYAMNVMRSRLAIGPGASLPYPYGGKSRQVQVDLNTDALQAKGLSGNDVVSAIASQNLILPGSTAKIGSLEYDVDLNGSPKRVEELNDLPIKMVGDSTIY